MPFEVLRCSTDVSFIGTCNRYDGIQQKQYRAKPHTRNALSVTSPQKKGNNPRPCFSTAGAVILHFRTCPSGLVRPPGTDFSYCVPDCSCSALSLMRSARSRLESAGGLDEPKPRKAKSIQPGCLDAHECVSRARRSGESGG